MLNQHHKIPFKHAALKTELVNLKYVNTHTTKVVIYCIILDYQLSVTTMLFSCMYLSMKAWCRRNMGSLAEPCTEDMEPFMKTCRALCMVL